MDCGYFLVPGCLEICNVLNARRFCDALELWAEDEIETPYFKSIAGEACLHAGMYDRGVDLLNQAEDLMHHTGEAWYLDSLLQINKKLLN